MIITAHAKRYSRALFQLAQQQSLIDPILQDFKNFLELVKQSSELREFLNMPLDLKRERLLMDLLKDQFSKLFLDFLILVLKNRRFNLIEQIFADYERQIDQLYNRFSVQAITAIPLPEDKLVEWKREIANAINAEVRLENQVDPSILGGIILRLDDRVYDASLIAQFKKLKVQLIQNQK
ncbi:MAG: ATP synthase F1 subunit delta [candidate division KSB1 bacterium]|nr:ATP synthase F1 subunit delta [candidate division KSB1 bacterium]MDZ7334400.1 ATP synthase F1 subunit delta [candidate division KSB1 bacterium]MDZ7358173.1 ATP synthase F1 subunit delta [candidate division KSB1 bacterium]MDZ7398793.1 ATP synthase F1 subunit delta [candidate division KSB1 bacterium]